MDDALLKRLIAGDYVVDVWNHISGNAVTVVYGQSGLRLRMLIGVEREGSIRPSQFYRSATLLCDVGGTHKVWVAERESQEKSVALAWAKAEPELLHALENGISVTPVSGLDPDFLNIAPFVTWEHERASDQ